MFVFVMRVVCSILFTLYIKLTEHTWWGLMGLEAKRKIMSTRHAFEIWGIPSIPLRFHEKKKEKYE